MENGFAALLKKLHKLLFDFSAGDKNRREVEEILVAVLAESKNDFDFDDTLRRVIVRYEGDRREGDARYIAFRRFMSLNERPGERLALYRIRAEHLLEDLPRIYGGPPVERLSPSASSPSRIPSQVSANDANTKEDNDDV